MKSEAFLVYGRFGMAKRADSAARDHGVIVPDRELVCRSSFLRKSRFRRLVIVFAFLSSCALAVESAKITVDVSKQGAAVPRGLYGIFFEEINHAGDGGLYAELVKNRGFEDANLPPACRLKGSFVVPPRTPHFWKRLEASDWQMPWNVDSKWPGWTMEASGGGDADFQLVEDHPLTAATPHSLQVTVRAVTSTGRVAVINSGYWGMAIQRGENYRLSLFVRGSGTSLPIVATLETLDGKELARSQVKTDGIGWQKYETTLHATATDPKAQLVLSFLWKGQVWLDFISLFPEKTFRNRPNGLRPDLAQMIADLKPGFIRFPGGCFVEGITIEDRPQWKRSIGVLEGRPGTYSPWGYWSTDGLGYHEFLQFADDIGADALYVVNAGISCAFRSGTFIPDDQLEPLVDDTLDAIEYAIGPVDSKWGARRAANGHPAPFPLKYIEVGNEDQGSRYGERVALFEKAIKAKYPQIKVVLSSWISGIDEPAIRAAGRVDLVDEHAYSPLYWPVEHFDSFASYPRKDWDLYIGEFATNGGVGSGNLLAALNDAAYMMSMEKNSDLVKMGSYAPLLENVNHPDWEVNMIHFDSSRAFGRATYYVNKLFAENIPTYNLNTEVDFKPAPSPIRFQLGFGTYNTAAEFKDAYVEREGKVIYRAAFNDVSNWKSPAGHWTADQGIYRQGEEAVTWTYLDDPALATPTNARTVVHVKARKLSGKEGFAITIGSAEGRRVQWNLGGWSNYQHAVETDDSIVGIPVVARIEAGRWYDVMLEVQDRSIRCFLDGALISEVTLPRPETVLAIAGAQAESGDVILKILNTTPETVETSVRLDGATHVAAEGGLTVLTSENVTDENSFDEPTKIAPVSRSIPTGNPSTVSLAPHSLNILRLHIKEKTQ
jgi:alpha-L-arabinofuranosidase